MKKIRITLYVVAIVGCVSSALAFKVNRASDFVWAHHPTDTKIDRCTFQSFGYTTNPALGGSFERVASTTAMTANCRTINIYFGE